jgi:AmiR/NasT family two-component response regulator
MQQLVGGLNLASWGGVREGRQKRMNAQHPDELQQLKIAACAVRSLRKFIALDEELDVEMAREALVQIEQAVIARTDAIEQAKGALRALEGCTVDEAFTELVEESQARNVKPHNVATQLLDALSSKGRPATS